MTLLHVHNHDRGEGNNDNGHLHLSVAVEQPKTVAVPRWRRWLVVGMMTAAVGMFATAFFLPWWHFTLYAPQYPHGLGLVLSLKGPGGDVSEIDELNHYIGMAHLESVAHTEEHYAAYGVAVVSLIVLVLTLLMGRKTGWLIILPAIGFPIGFVLDSFYWLYHCGHELDPHAPIHLSPFTPQMFGNGQIGQFLTFAAPSSGFWLAAAGAVVVIAATVLRQRAVCAVCSQRGTCGAFCKYGFMGKEVARPSAW